MVDGSRTAEAGIPNRPAALSGAPRWCIAGATVCGAAHARAGRPNQDAIRWEPNADVAQRLVLAVADGHGAAEATHSAIGARLAVDTAVRVLSAASQRLDAERAQDLTALCERLAIRICIAWRTANKQHLRQTPLDAGDRDRAAEPAQLRAYGSTLLAAAVAGGTTLLVQLGDGDVLAVFEDGRVIRPLPPDVRLVANATTSLASPRPWRDVRSALLLPDSPVPALLLLASDGYANAFRDDRAFLQVGADLLDLLRAHGVAPVAEQLPGWLAEASRLGSGDDVTLGLLLREDLLPEPPEAEPAALAEADR